MQSCSIASLDELMLQMRASFLPTLGFLWFVGDDDDDGNDEQADTAEEVEAASVGQQAIHKSPAHGPSQKHATAWTGAAKPPSSRDTQNDHDQPGPDEDDAWQDPLANRLEVADAEQDNTLQASRDQPTAMTDLAEAANPLSAAAADAAADAADAAAEVTMPQKARADGAAAEVDLVLKAKAAVAAAGAASGQQPASRPKRRSSSKGTTTPAASASRIQGDGMPSEPFMDIPPDSDAEPAGIPQPTLKGQPISPANNVASAARSPGGPGKTKHQAQPASDMAAAARQADAPSPVSSKKAGDVQEMKDSAVPSLGNLDFSGLQGINVFRKRTHASPGQGGPPSGDPTAGSKPAAAMLLKTGAALPEHMTASREADAAVPLQSHPKAEEPSLAGTPAASEGEIPLDAEEAKPKAPFDKVHAESNGQESNHEMPDIQVSAKHQLVCAVACATCTMQSWCLQLMHK